MTDDAAWLATFNAALLGLLVSRRTTDHRDDMPVAAAVEGAKLVADDVHGPRKRTGD